jgi:hypothetical protein
MAVKEISNEQLSDDEKDARGRIWVTDNGITYWYESLDDILAWMEEDDSNTYTAILWREAERRKRANG